MSWLPRRTIVVPIDFSDESLAALDVALDIATLDPAKARVHAIHVLPELSPLEPGVVWRTINDETRSHHAKKALRQRLAADQQTYQNVELHVAFGDPGHEIAHFAQQSQADLIVIPSHGRTGLQRLLIGSVAERVVRLAHCPVLVLRK